MTVVNDNFSVTQLFKYQPQKQVLMWSILGE